jgi:hypothetical protein
MANDHQIGRLVWLKGRIHEGHRPDGEDENHDHDQQGNGGPGDLDPPRAEMLPRLSLTPARTIAHDAVAHQTGHHEEDDRCQPEK